MPVVTFVNSETPVAQDAIFATPSPVVADSEIEEEVNEIPDNLDDDKFCEEVLGRLRSIEVHREDMKRNYTRMDLREQQRYDRIKLLNVPRLDSIARARIGKRKTNKYEQFFSGRLALRDTSEQIELTDKQYTLDNYTYEYCPSAREYNIKVTGATMPDDEVAKMLRANMPGADVSGSTTSFSKSKIKATLQVVDLDGRRIVVNSETGEIPEGLAVVKPKETVLDIKPGVS